MVNSELSMILSIAEIRLCLNVLGYEQWNDLPLIETEESVEQRLMNAFLRLIQTNYLLPVTGGYKLNPALRQRILCIGQAECVYRLYEKEHILAFLYKKDCNIVGISPVLGQREFCKIWLSNDTSPADILTFFSNHVENAENLVIKEKEKTNIEKSLYDIEELTLFFEIDKKRRE